MREGMKGYDLLHAMWMGPLGSVLLAGGIALAHFFPLFAPFFILSMSTIGAWLVIAASWFAGSEGFRQLQK